MAHPRTFDYGKLEQLMLEHPAWDYYALWKVLREDNGRLGRPEPSFDAVKRASWNIRKRREAQGLAPVTVHEEVAPPMESLNQEYKRAKQMRYLRDLAQAAAGDVPGSEAMKTLRQTALAWAEKMRAARTVVDLTKDGEPIEREARPEEVTSRGELVSLMAWKVPGWRGMNTL